MKTGSFLDQVKSVYTGKKEGHIFRIVEDTINYCKIEVDNGVFNIRVYGIERAKDWCNKFTKNK